MLEDTLESPTEAWERSAAPLCSLCEAAALVVVDFAALLLAFSISYVGFEGGGSILAPLDFLDPSALAHDRRAIFLGTALALLFVAWANGRYSKRQPFWNEIKYGLEAIGFGALLNGALLFMANLSFARYAFVGTWVAAALFLPVFRMAGKALLMRCGLWTRPTVIIGTGTNARSVHLALISDRLMGYKVVAFASQDLGDQSNVTEAELNSVPIVPFDRAFAARSEATWGEAQYIVALDDLVHADQIVRALSRSGLRIQVVPPVLGIPLHGTEMIHFLGQEVLMLRIRNNLARPGLALMKRALDLTIAALLLAILSPFFVVAVALSKASGGAAFYRHPRVGRAGRPFLCYKFRTMVPDADRVLCTILSTDLCAREEWDRTFKLRNDPRVTKFGAFLRRTSLDELPQLWNVIRGEMSLVGPRPIVQSEIARYGEMAEYYFMVRPGITGLWQASGRTGVDYSSRVALDVWYARNWSPWYDLVILMKTVKAVLKMQGAY